MISSFNPNIIGVKYSLVVWGGSSHHFFFWPPFWSIVIFLWIKTLGLDWGSIKQEYYCVTTGENTNAFNKFLHQKAQLVTHPPPQRNLTLESVFYAAWTGIRYADPAVTQWREGWLNQSMRGGRRHANTNDITYKLALLWEESHYSQQRIVSLFLDRAKCFDRNARLKSWWEKLKKKRNKNYGKVTEKVLSVPKFTANLYCNLRLSRCSTELRWYMCLWLAALWAAGYSPPGGLSYL